MTSQGLCPLRGEAYIKTPGGVKLAAEVYMYSIGLKRAVFALAALLVVTAIVLSVCAVFPDGAADAATLKQGSTGDKVREMQQKLKSWGYYDGAVDGIFGSGTREAVKYFQRVNGLSADGVVGAATAAALGMTLSSSSSSGSVSSSSGTLRRGSTGDKVREMQQKLKNWGYYDGAADGIFGSGTESAVKHFQRVNGLSADGVVGAATAAALGMTLSSSSSSGSGSSGVASSDLELLARVVYGEARGEEYVGQVAVAAVVLNRVKSPSFPNTIAGVVYQSGAFDCVADGQINLTPNATARKAAQDALNGWDPTYGCLFYYNPRTATSAWMLSRPVKLVIGQHNFC